MPIDDEDSRLVFLRKELEAALARNHLLERENQELKQEVGRLKAQVSAFKAHDHERKSMLWKKLQNSIDSTNTDRLQQRSTAFEIEGKSPAAGSLKPAEDFLESAAEKGKPTRVPKPPPPKPTTSASLTKAHEYKVPSAVSPAPPPPPPPPANLLVRTKAVRRVPEVVEFYRLLMKRDAQKENKTSPTGTPPPVINPRNMIGEIENRSTYLLSVKSDVETQREFINSLTRAVETAAFTDMSDVEAFVKWLDGELSCLVDERAVLKHFPQWPEKKADALREAAFSYRDLKNVESEVSSFKDNPKQLLIQSMRRMQALQDRLERSVNNIERLREGTSKRYKEFSIPWEWMLDTGVVGQMKVSSLALAKQYMRRVTKEMQYYNESLQEQDLLLQGVRFAFRVHQFAGGFDAETKQAFEELRSVRTGQQKQQHANTRPNRNIE